MEGMDLSQFTGWASLITAVVAAYGTLPLARIVLRFVDAHPDIWTPNAITKWLLNTAVLLGTCFVIAHIMAEPTDYKSITSAAGSTLILLGMTNGKVDKVTDKVSDKINSMLIKKEGE